jgi:hypothetical protein
MNQIKVLALEEINFPRKKFCNYENCAKFLKMQIMSKESAQNAFVNQEPSRFLI